jgi:hypothetical protein
MKRVKISRRKIILLAEKLDISYDNMVSLKLDNNLAPIGEILKSGSRNSMDIENDLIDIACKCQS